MLRTLLRGLALVAAAVAVLAAVQILLTPEAPSTPYDAPDRLELRDEDSSDYREIVTLKARTPITGVTFRRDDGIVLDIYANGVVSHTEEYWPPDDDRYLPKRIADYNNESLLIKELLFRKDGSLEQAGARSSDLTWLQQKFDKDGTTLLVSTVFAGPGKSILTETRYDALGHTILFAEMENGTTLHVSSRQNDLITESWEDGRGAFRVIEYDAAGRIWKKWQRVDFTTELTVYAENGSVTSRQVWNYDGSLEIKNYSPDGSLSLRRAWRPTTTASYGIILREVEVAVIGSGTIKYLFGYSDGDFTVESPQMFGYKYVLTYKDWFLTEETTIYPNGQHVTREPTVCSCKKPQLPEFIVELPEIWKLPLVLPLLPPPPSENHSGNFTPTSPFKITSSFLYQKRGQ